jgi:hypothetical protein
MNKPNMPAILGIESDWDPATHAGSEYRNTLVYPYFNGKNYPAVRLHGHDATRVNVVQKLKDPAIKYITGVGHGNADVFTGDNGSIVFKVGQYDKSEVRGKIVHFLSCVTAKKLGPDFVKNGCKAYFGYEEPFAFNDHYKEVFFRCDAEIDLAIADKLPALEVHARAEKMFKQAVNLLNDEGQFYIAAMLQTDLNILRSPVYGTSWGDPDAKI